MKAHKFIVIFLLTVVVFRCGLAQEIDSSFFEIKPTRQFFSPKVVKALVEQDVWVYSGKIISWNDADGPQIKYKKRGKWRIEKMRLLIADAWETSKDHREEKLGLHALKITLEQLPVGTNILFVTERDRLDFFKRPLIHIWLPEIQMTWSQYLILKKLATVYKPGVKQKRRRIIKQMEQYHFD